MTDPNYTALMLIVDRSGSMSSIRTDMLGTMQQLLADQIAQPGLLTLDVFSFDDTVERTHAFADPTTVTLELEPRGMTALYDAVGVALTDLGQRLADLPEHARPDTVLVAIVTDGEENASREYSATAVRELIAQQSETYNWEFVYLGANQHAVLVARDLGIDADSAMTYAPAADAIAGMGASLSRYTTDIRRKQKRGFSDGERREAGGAA